MAKNCCTLTCHPRSAKVASTGQATVFSSPPGHSPRTVQASRWGQLDASLPSPWKRCCWNSSHARAPGEKEDLLSPPLFWWSHVYESFANHRALFGENRPLRLQRLCWGSGISTLVAFSAAPWNQQTDEVHRKFLWPSLTLPSSPEKSGVDGSLQRPLLTMSLFPSTLKPGRSSHPSFLGSQAPL